MLCQPLAQAEPGLASCGHHTADTSAPSLGLQPLLLGQPLALRSLVPQAPASFVLKSDPVVDYWGEGRLWGWAALGCTFRWVSCSATFPHRKPWVSPLPAWLCDASSLCPAAAQGDGRRHHGARTAWPCQWPWQPCPKGETASPFGKGLRLFACGFPSVSTVSWHMPGCSMSPLRGAASWG